MYKKCLSLTRALLTRPDITLFCVDKDHQNQFRWPLYIVCLQAIEA